MSGDARMDLDNSWDHPECFCLRDERCRYHQALDRAETLAAENARLRGALNRARREATIKTRIGELDRRHWQCSICLQKSDEDTSADVEHLDTCPFAALAANPQAAPAPAETGETV